MLGNRVIKRTQVVDELELFTRPWQSNAFPINIAEVGKQITAVHITQAKPAFHILENPAQYIRSDFAELMSSQMRGWMLLMAGATEESWLRGRKLYEERLAAQHGKLVAGLRKAIIDIIETFKRSPNQVYRTVLDIVESTMVQILYGNYLIDPDRYITELRTMISLVYDVVRNKNVIDKTSDMHDQDRQYAQSVQYLIDAGVKAYQAARQGGLADNFWGAMHEHHRNMIVEQLQNLGWNVNWQENNLAIDESTPLLTDLFGTSVNSLVLTPEMLNALVARSVAAELWAMMVAQAETMPGMLTSAITMLGIDTDLQQMLREVVRGNDAAKKQQYFEIFAGEVHGLYAPVGAISRKIAPNVATFNGLQATLEPGTSLVINLTQIGRSMFGINDVSAVNLPYKELFFRLVNKSGIKDDAMRIVNLMYGGDVNSPKHCMGQELALGFLRMFYDELANFAIDPIDVSKCSVMTHVVSFLRSSREVSFRAV